MGPCLGELDRFRRIDDKWARWLRFILGGTFSIGLPVKNQSHAGCAGQGERGAIEWQ